MGVWQWVARDSLKFHLGLASPTLLRPPGGPPLKQPYGQYRVGPLAGCTAVYSIGYPTLYAYIKCCPEMAFQTIVHSSEDVALSAGGRLPTGRKSCEDVAVSAGVRLPGCRRRKAVSRCSLT
jgi:hypothetical protein